MFVVANVIPTFRTYPSIVEPIGGMSEPIARGASIAVATCAATPSSQQRITGRVRGDATNRQMASGRKIEHCGSVATDTNATAAIRAAPRVERGVASSSHGVRYSRNQCRFAIFPRAS